MSKNEKKSLLLIAIFILVLSTLVHAIYNDLEDWRDGRRYHCSYFVRVTGLSEKEVQGTTLIMVPIPASKEGKFFIPPAQKDPYFTQKLWHVIFGWPDDTRRGPYFRNMTEIFDKQQEIIGGWIPFIAETEKGYMLGFRSNETRLEDIDFISGFVADYIDIFDPINDGSPVLFPVENVTNISSIPYGEYTLYASNPTYDTYVYLSDNLKGVEPLSFDIQLDANNDPTEWSEKYRGRYSNLLLAKVSETGYVKVKAIMGQEVPFGNDSFNVLGTQYARDYYGDEAYEV